MQPVPVSYISDYFIALSNTTGSLITNLKLQKLVYYAQAWNLAVCKTELISEDFQAWIHGPVVPELYNCYKDFKWNPIVREDLSEEALKTIYSKLSGLSQEVLSDVVEEYFCMDAYALEKSTHNEQPWLQARIGLAEDEPSTNIISKDSMIEFYSQYVING